MSKAQMELIKQGLKVTDVNELTSLLDLYYSKCQAYVYEGYDAGIRILRGHYPVTENNFEFIRDKFKKASETMLDAAAMFDPDCLIDLLNCED